MTLAVDAPSSPRSSAAPTHIAPLDSVAIDMPPTEEDFATLALDRKRTEVDAPERQTLVSRSAAAARRLGACLDRPLGRVRRAWNHVALRRRDAIVLSTAITTGVGCEAMTILLMNQALSPPLSSGEIAGAVLSGIGAGILGSLIGGGTAALAIRCYDRNGPRVPRHPETVISELNRRAAQLPSVVLGIVADYVYDNERGDYHDMDLRVRATVDGVEGQWVFRAEADRMRAAVTANVDRRLVAADEHRLTGFGQTLRDAGVGIDPTPRRDVLALSFDLMTSAQATMTGRQLRSLEPERRTG